MTADPLLSPFQLSGLRLKNRIVSTAHSSRYTSEGLPTERYRRYQEQKARGGVGLISVGGSAVVSRDSTPSFGNITMYKDEVVEPLRRVAESCQENGSAVVIQLTHLGRRTDDHSADWLPSVSSAPMREPAHRSHPKQAEPWDLDRIAADFAAAAARSRAAGLNGIELEHYGHLLDSFVSPWHLSKLEPAEADAAMRFPERVITAVRESMGPDMVLGIRMAVDEVRADGLGVEAAVALLRRYSALGVQYVNVIVGTIESPTRLSEVIPGAGRKSAPFLDIAGQIRRTAGIPVMHAAKIDDVATARHAIAHGLLDLVGMTRATIADPYLVRKVEAGQEETIRPCVGARYCLEGGATGGIVCIHNPAVGREAHLRHEIDQPADRSRRVVIIGAGPAGLEAAQVAAKRGHRVTVFEAASEPGGQVRLLTANDRRRDLIGTIDWRYSEARRNGAEFRFSTFVEPDDVYAAGADVVIVATGGTARTAHDAGLPSAVRDIWEVFEQPRKQYGTVMLVDDDGRYPSLDAVEILATAGNAVTYVTPERTIAVDAGALNFSDYQAAFDRHDVSYRLTRTLQDVEPGTGTGKTAVLGAEDGSTRERVPCDAIFYAGGTVPNDDLYRALRSRSANAGRVDYEAFIGGRAQPRDGEGLHLYRIGDAVSSRNLHAAVLDAHRIALGL